jgi:hypothetical protein
VTFAKIVVDNALSSNHSDSWCGGVPVLNRERVSSLARTGIRHTAPDSGVGARHVDDELTAAGPSPVTLTQAVMRPSTTVLSTCSGDGSRANPPVLPTFANQHRDITDRGPADLSPEPLR